MLDLKRIRQDPDGVRAALARRGAEGLLDQLLATDLERLTVLASVEGARARKNAASEEIGRLRRQGQNAEEAILAMRRLGDALQADEAALAALSERQEQLLLRIPNIPHADIPDGDERHNLPLSYGGTPPALPFSPKPHWEIGTHLGILDFDGAGRISGSRFTVYRGEGARLLRALAAFMIDFHGKRGYEEISPPLLVHEECLIGTGQLPKFQEDLFRTTDGRYLIPTAEVPLTNLHREEILAAERLPIRYCALTSCFRAEAGAAGRDTRGLIRNHQFEKVEMVQLVAPEHSRAALDELVASATGILDLLELPWRVVELAAGDLGFSAARTRDVEVWMPGADTYREISSCSMFEDFQARRASIRYRDMTDGRVYYLHTLNGSGLAIGRTIAALLENHQQEDGSVRIPAALRPYMEGMTTLQPLQRHP